MIRPVIAVLFIMIFFIMPTETEARQADPVHPIRQVMEIPDVGRICTLDPTDRNAHFTIQPDSELQYRLKASAGASFEVEYRLADSACGDSDWPEEAYEAFEYAMDIWAAHLSSPIPIIIDANWSGLDENTLGSAGSVLGVQLSNPGEQDAWKPDTWYTTAQASALLGEDVLTMVGGTHDIRININCSFSDWYFGIDGNPPAGKIDFVTVVLHEIGHGIGFSGTLSALPGEEEDEFLDIAGWGLRFEEEGTAYPYIYDRFALDGDGNSIIDNSVYENPSEELYRAITGRNGGINFDGEDALSSVDGMGMDQVLLYTPRDFRQGSSYSHLDQMAFTDTPNALMRPFVDRAMAVHSPGPLFCGMLSDMGWPLGGGCLGFLAADAIVSMDLEELDFGVTNVNQTEDRILTIRNEESASEPLIGNLTLEHDDFRFLSNPSFILDPGESVSIGVRYQPNNIAMHRAEITLFHNANNRSTPIMIPISGEALAADAIVQLEQSFPNPTVGSGSSSTIPYAISEDSDVKIDLYSVDGRHVKSLVNDRQNSGRYEVNIDMHDLAGGVYLYRVMINNVVETGKLLHVR